ncbi:GMC family oxidoreductase [Orrella daihaiensis]|uniref:GMC family oxidoreductase N-terminal domain-containing protein n=1 Tax=Orrella daihaiensis TaxID=2782176 RepID=A0ABY4AN12_9BURK|nr:GMC family oxidoreductase N-terminal domain-containing protein [Orrella daihaiensis]UOD50452.1 GMC family oxidoreductase N-terminal domain-containing protein [Orrella daihaiensis]
MPTDSTNRSNTPSAGEFDYIVVGAGTAGCLLANRLSADPSKRVLLLEAGGKDNYHWIHIPVGYLYCIGNPRTDWLFKTEADPGLNGRQLGYPRGKVMGGCSSINGMIYMRGQRQDYDSWRDAGNEGWGWDDVLPIFKSMEDYHGGASDMHGAGGEWRVEKQRLSWEILDAFREAAAQAGIPKIEDFNRGDNEGASYFEVNQRSGWRWNAVKAFIKPIEHRTNLTILTHARTTSLIFDGKRATGVEFVRHAQKLIATAKGAVVLAAGSIGSVQILQSSGIGPATLLQKLNIPVLHDLPGVGRNLQDHLQIRTVFKIQNAKSLNTMANSLWGKAKMGLQYLINRTGPLSMAPSQLGVFAKSDPSYDRANVEYHVQPLSLEKFGDPLHDFPAFTASVCNLRPSSRGFVEIVSPDTDVAPRINCCYLSTEEDRKVAAQSIELTRRIVAQPALALYHPEEIKPGPEITSPEALAQAAGDIATTIFHPVGTCKMGKDEMAVVDSSLRVHGIDGLWVADASVMPTITSGNTNSPTLVIAQKAADAILQLT